MKGPRRFRRAVLRATSTLSEVYRANGLRGDERAALLRRCVGQVASALHRLRRVERRGAATFAAAQSARQRAAAAAAARRAGGGAHVKIRARSTAVAAAKTATAASVVAAGEETPR